MTLCRFFDMLVCVSACHLSTRRYLASAHLLHFLCKHTRTYAFARGLSGMTKCAFFQHTGQRPPPVCQGLRAELECLQSERREQGCEADAMVQELAAHSMSHAVEYRLWLVE